MVTNPLVMLLVILLYSLMGDVLSPLLLRRGTVSDKSMSSFASIMFCGL